MRIQGVIAVAVVSAGLAGVIGFICGLFLTRPSRENTAAQITSMEKNAAENKRIADQEYSDLNEKLTDLKNKNARLSNSVVDRDKLIKQLQTELSDMDQRLTNLKKKEAASVEDEIPISPPQIYSVWDDVIVGNIKWGIVTVTNMGSTLRNPDKYASKENRTKTTSGIFIKIKMEIENCGTNARSVKSEGINVGLVDSVGRKYISSTDMGDWIPDNEELVNLNVLNPNVTVQFTEIFEIPKNAEELNVIVSNLTPSGFGKAHISLGRFK